VNSSSKNIYFFRLFVIDTLFAPFFLPFPLFALIWPFWFIKQLNDRKIDVRIAAVGATGSLFAVASYVSGLAETGVDQELAQNRFLYTGVICYMFATYSVATANAYQDRRFLELSLAAYLFFTAALSIIFIIDPAIFFFLRNFWSYSSESISIDSITTLTRFTGILSDPNNVAVTTCAIGAFLIFNYNNSVLKSLMYLILLLTITITSMSATGFICLALVIGSFIFVSKFADKPATNSLLRLSAMVGVVAAIFLLWLVLKDTVIFNLAIERLQESDADSRFSRWRIVEDGPKILSSVILGDGGTIIWNGQNYKPHNGHFHVFFSFGFIAYLAFFVTFFRIQKGARLMSYLFLGILFIGFTVNVGIYELRFAGVWVILLAYMHGTEMRQSMSRISGFKRARARRASQHRVHV